MTPQVGVSVLMCLLCHLSTNVWYHVTRISVCLSDTVFNFFLTQYSIFISRPSLYRVSPRNLQLTSTDDLEPSTFRSPYWGSVVWLLCINNKYRAHCHFGFLLVMSRVLQKRALVSHNSHTLWFNLGDACFLEVYEWWSDGIRAWTLGVNTGATLYHGRTGKLGKGYESWRIGRFWG